MIDINRIKLDRLSVEELVFIKFVDKLTRNEDFIYIRYYIDTELIFGYSINTKEIINVNIEYHFQGLYDLHKHIFIKNMMKKYLNLNVEKIKI